MSAEDRVRMNILLIDDDPDILRSIGEYLEDTGHRVFTVSGGAEGVQTLRREAVDIVITDVRMPGMDGFEVLREARRAWPGVEVIVVTAHGDVEGAVRAMREGAFDFFTKPVRLRELNASLERTVRFHALRREKDRYRERLDRLGAEERRRYGLSAIIGDGAAIRAVRELIEQVCRADATTVLICGETGTGKELVARAVHWGSGRAGGPFVAVDCSAVPETLFESEFYGHVKGAFTGAQEARKGHFELADGGTLFLDEVGDMDLTTQAKLLRTLEERRVRRVGGAEATPVDVRVVAATNKDLSRAISEGKFREDLYYRLNTFLIQAPPLRERPGDIPLLAGHFLDRYRREMRRAVEGFTPEAEALLRAHPFPGNVRELRNLIERAVILCRAERVTPEDLRFETPRALSPGPLEDLNLEASERRLIREALQRSGGNQVQAARLLGISRDALRRRMENYQL